MGSEAARLVFFTDPPERAEYYQKEFSHPRASYEAVPPSRFSGLDKFFSDLSFLLLRTETTKLRRKMALEEDRRYVAHGISAALNVVLARKWIRKIVRALDYRLVKTGDFAAYFDKYKPDAVFLAHLFEDHEIHLLGEARRRGVRTIGFINSWDKLTIRHATRLLPDSLMVFNNTIKEEALRYADMKERDIFVSGIPQYDWHVNYKPISRSEFCKKKNLDPAKKIIVYAPMGKTFSDSDWDIIDLLHNSITHQLITHNSQLFIRFQPNDFVDEAELKKRPWLKYDYPGVRFSKKRGVNWDMSFDDIRGLTDTLANADLFICYASSMSVDAAVFDKPIININFEIKEKQSLSKTPTFFYRTEHYGKAIRAGAMRLPKSKEELIRDINQYLANPALDREGRQRLVREQCGNLDGHAGKKIAEYLLNSESSQDLRVLRRQNIGGGV